MIIQALPSAGKSYLAQRENWLDLEDDILVQPEFDGYVRWPEDLNGEDADIWSRGLQLLQNRKSDPNWHVTTCYFVGYTGIEPDLIIGYHPKSYVNHIKLAGRADLFVNFGKYYLEEWARDYLTEGAILIESYHFLGDIIDPEKGVLLEKVQSV